MHTVIHRDSVGEVVIISVIIRVIIAKAELLSRSAASSSLIVSSVEGELRILSGFAVAS